MGLCVRNLEHQESDSVARREYAREFYRRYDTCACPVCNLTYAADYDEDRKTHRVFHKRVVDVFEPRPSVTLAKEYAKHGECVPVGPISNQYLRRRLEHIARVFKREFGCDFTMYSEVGDDGHGFLLSDP